MRINNFSIASTFLAFTLFVSFLPISPLTFFAEAIAPTTLFSDGFEYTNIGSASSPWVRSPNNPNKWGFTASDSRTGNKSAKVENNTHGSDDSSPDGLYSTTTTTSYENIKLTFWYKAFRLESSDNDYVNVEWSSEGSNWTSVSGSTIDSTNDYDTPFDEDIQTEWIIKEVSLVGVDNLSMIYFKFVANLSTSSDVVFIDDVSIVGDEIVIDEPDEELVCGDGFEPNEAGTECVLVDNSDDNEEEEEGEEQTSIQLSPSEPPQSLSGGRRRGGTSGGEVLGVSTSSVGGEMSSDELLNKQKELLKLLAELLRLLELLSNRN